MFLAERNLLAFLMKLGHGVMGRVFECMGKDYEGAVVNKEGRKYKFVGYRATSLHGLFRMIEYKHRLLKCFHCYHVPPPSADFVNFKSPYVPKSSLCTRCSKKPRWRYNGRQNLWNPRS